MTIRPVTQTAEVAVNRASIRPHERPGGEEKGRYRRNVPSAITAAKPIMMIWEGESPCWRL